MRAAAGAAAQAAQEAQAARSAPARGPPPPAGSAGSGPAGRGGQCRRPTGCGSGHTETSPSQCRPFFLAGTPSGPGSGAHESPPIDAGQRLPAHFHPGRAFARAAFGSDHGKTEAWLIVEATNRLPRWNVAAAMVLVTLVSLVWLKRTVDYLSEWQDPRSVWYAATRKTDDFHVYYELGWEYLDKSAGLGTKPRNPPVSVEQSKKLASLVWKDDARLPQLLSELSTDQHTGPPENAFKEYLQTKASENFDRALATKGEHLMPDLFLSRGVLLLDKGEMQSAKKEFLAELDEVSQMPSPEGRQEALVACYYNLAVAEDGLGNSGEALSWIRRAEQEQHQLGKTIIPGLSEDRQKLESTTTTRDQP